MAFPDARALLEVFPNPAPERDYEILHTAHEFTSVCPVTGQPDFATLTFRYIAEAQCVELKSLKLYLQGFRNEGVFYEALVNRLLDDLVGVLAPRHMEIVGEFSVRGGMSTVVTALYDGPAS
ncbi:MAG: preQ(1) synthase [Planctomycetota bacterium]|nr:preQ(1) synthase [Planctomycetota bacterium]